MAKKTVVGGGSGKGSSKKKVRADNSATADDCQGDDRDQEETASEENPTHLEEISAADLLAQSSQSSNMLAGSVVEETTPSFVWLSEDYSTNRVPKLENPIVSESEGSQSHPRASTECVFFFLEVIFF
ncbi:hypothetical protein OESDEN_22380 [Oesophagostomum dentatum]|uniref:Uncharacterized protein n=1 Tax=Oesophagostomum dentatum TaxID=61180 RepID=A0A0B1S435_OESDE|nr:hypothetical protein OESDEN_22380 [Oesophagostomum dentatum]